jgi:hypothetical protein
MQYALVIKYNAYINLYSQRLSNRVISVVEFSREGYKIKKVLGYKSIFQDKLLYSDVAASCQKVSADRDF